LADGPAAPLERVQKLQTSLQAKAKAEPAFRFYSLWDKVCRADVLEEAYRACRRNGGAPGCDGMTFDRITSLGRERWLEELRQELRAGECRPQPLCRSAGPTCRVRRPDDAGESRMRAICMSGLTSGDWKRSYGSGEMRHRPWAKAAGHPLLLGT